MHFDVQKGTSYHSLQLKGVLSMKKTLFLILTMVVLFSVSTAYAECYVEDGTFYSNSKLSMSAFVMYMDRDGEHANLDKALQMVDDGRIKSCTKASCSVIERTKEGLVNVNILGIGTVWIHERFLHCD
jgi:hypothetical protein